MNDLIAPIFYTRDRIWDERRSEEQTMIARGGYSFRRRLPSPPPPPPPPPLPPSVRVLEELYLGGMMPGAVGLGGGYRFKTVSATTPLQNLYPGAAIPGAAGLGGGYSFKGDVDAGNDPLNSYPAAAVPGAAVLGD